jgi:hypothetical protein
MIQLPNLGSYNQILTYSQYQTVYKMVSDLLENLDDLALRELWNSLGSEKDMDKLLDILIEETTKALFTSKGKIKNFSFGYMDKLTEGLDSLLRSLSFNYFTVTTLPNFEMNWHHLEWGNLVQIYKYIAILAARDHSKSYTFSLAYPLWKLFRYKKPTGVKKIDKELGAKKGIIITAEFTLGKEFLSGIKEEITTNNYLRDKLYATGDGAWGMSEIKCKNNAELQIKSIDSKLRGRHPHWMVVDDILDESSLFSAEIRRDTIDFFHSNIMNMIVPGGQVVVVGTPFMAQDLYMDLKSKSAWKVFEYPAIFPNGNLLWESRYNLDSLLEKRQTQGSIIFSREILVKPVSSDSTIFPYEMLKKCFSDSFTLVKNYYSHPIKFDKIVVGLDFAISAEVAADYSVFLTIGVEGRGDNERYFILDIWREKGVNYSRQISELKSINSNFEPTVMVGEDNTFQKIMIDLATDAGLPVIGHTTTTNKYDLRSGLPGLAVLFEQGRIIVPRGDQYSIDMTDILISELSSIAFTDKGLQGVGDHDDTVYSLWKALIAAKYMGGSFSYTFI